MATSPTAASDGDGRGGGRERERDGPGVDQKRNAPSAGDVDGRAPPGPPGK